MKVYSSEQTGTDGQTYYVRYLLDPEELACMQQAGLIPENAMEVIGMQDVADSIIAGLQKQLHTAAGGLVQ